MKIIKLDFSLTDTLQMKKSAILLYCLIFGISINAKAGDFEIGRGKSQIGLTFSSLGSNDLTNHPVLIGGPGYRSDGFNAFGINYIYKLNRKFDFETGIEYTEYKIIVEPNLHLIYGGTSYSVKFSLIEIPATMRVNFLKYFFVNGGVFLDINAGNSGGIQSSEGLGANLGLGLRYDLNRTFSIFVNPYAKVHSIISFSSTDSQQLLFESGFRFGVMVRLE